MLSVCFINQNCKETRERRLQVALYRGVAQLAAHLVWDQGVAGSNPAAST